MCLDNFKFYPIYDQKGLSKHQDGILGIAPVQTSRHSDEGPSFVHELKRAEVIDRGVVGLFVSRFHKKQSSIQIGDYDTETYVDGGDKNLHWYSLTLNDNLGTWRWQTDLT